MLPRFSRRRRGSRWLKSWMHRIRLLGEGTKGSKPCSLPSLAEGAGDRQGRVTLHGAGGTARALVPEDMET